MKLSELIKIHCHYVPGDSSRYELTETQLNSIKTTALEAGYHAGIKTALSILKSKCDGDIDLAIFKLKALSDKLRE